MSLKQTQNDMASLLGFAGNAGNLKQARKGSAFARSAGLYRDLVSFGLHETMASIFPACSKLLGEARFHRRVDDYLRKHPPDHFRLNMIGRHFPEYLSRQSRSSLPWPFITELADYEWVELMLMECPVETPPAEAFPPESSSRWETSSPVLNPVLELRRYNYRIPDIVTEIDCDGSVVSSKSSPISIIIFRDPNTKVVRFLELKPIPAALVGLMKDSRHTYLELTERLHREFADIEADQLITNIGALLKYFYQEGVLIGSRLKEANPVESQNS